MWRENLCADSVVAVIFYVNPADKWTVSLRVWCNVFSQSCRGCWSSRGLTNVAARRPPSRRRRRLSSCYLRCPWIRERISFLPLPSCPASYSRHARECVCVCVWQVDTHIDNTVRDTQRLKYTHTHLNTNIEKGTKNHTEPRLSGCCIRTEKHPLLQLLLLKLTTFRWGKCVCVCV